MTQTLSTRELIAWELDAYPPRPAVIDQSHAREALRRRPAYEAAQAICESGTMLLRESLNDLQDRADLQAEMQGLSWRLAVVDLRTLIAFQRRLTFNPGVPKLTPPAPTDWQSLLQIAFAEPLPITCELTHAASTVTLRSANPNLHLRPTRNPAAPLEVYAGGPFFEVALYCERWFLRDGYHRAYTLLQAGIFHMPAVVVHARTLDELGATGERFFLEDTLFSARPPMLTDFLDPALTTTYTRPPTVTTLRITWDESIAPAGDMA